MARNAPSAALLLDILFEDVRLPHRMRRNSMQCVGHIREVISIFLACLQVHPLLYLVPAKEEEHDKDAQGGDGRIQLREPLT